MKTVTICGSYRFKESMYKVYDVLTEIKYAVFLPAINGKENPVEYYRQLHRYKIDISDCIFVVDCDFDVSKEKLVENRYIGKDTMMEIQYAEQTSKMIFYLSEFRMFSIIGRGF